MIHKSFQKRESDEQAASGTHPKSFALFLLSAAASFVFFLPIGAMLLVIGLRQGVPASVDSYEEMSVDDPGSERAR